MKNRQKWAAGIGVAAMFGMALWMRELASWRPVVVARVPSGVNLSRLQLAPGERFLLIGSSAIFDLQQQKWAPKVPAGNFYSFAANSSYFSVLYQSKRGSDYASHCWRRDLASGRVLWSANGFKATIADFPLAFLLSPDTRKTLILTRTALKIFDERGKLLSRHPLDGTRDGFWASEGFLTPQGALIRAQGFDLTSRDTATWRLRWLRHDKPFNMGDITGDGQTLWVAVDGLAHFLDAATGKDLWQRPLTPSQAAELPPTGFGFSGDSRIVALMNETQVDFVKVRTGQILSSKRGIGAQNLTATVPSSDGNWLYAIDKSGRILRFRLR